MGNPYKPVELVIFEHFLKKNWDALHARLSNYYEAWIYKKKKKKKDERHTGKLFRKNLQIKDVNLSIL